MSLIRWAGILTVGLIALLGGWTVDAAQPDSKLKVGISSFSPFAILTGEEPTGASIDFWHQASTQIEC